MPERQKLISRRGFLRLGAGTATSLIIGCGDEEKGKDWKTLSPAERIKTLENRGLGKEAYRDLGNLDPYRELPLAVAEFYCSQTRCLRSPSEMAKNVFFVDSNQFLAVFEKDVGRTLSREEAEDVKTDKLETTTVGRQIFFNLPLLNDQFLGYRTHNPALVREFEGRGINLEAKVFDSILFHAYTHANSSRREFEFDPFSLSIKGSFIKFGKMKGFAFEGKNESGGSFFINGSDEAATELTARLIGARVSPYLISSDRYGEGMQLIADICVKASIPEEEFIRYNNELPIEQLLARWGALKNPTNPDKKAAILTLAAIGLYVDGFTTLEGAQNAIQEFLFTR